MRRAVVFCHARSQWWHQQAITVVNGPQELQEGRRAYAFAHADAETQLGNRWAERWRPLRDEAEEFMQRFPLYGDNGLAALYGQEDDDDEGGDGDEDQENGPDDHRGGDHGLRHNGGDNGRNVYDRRNPGQPNNGDDDQGHDNNNEQNNDEGRQNHDEHGRNDGDQQQNGDVGRANNGNDGDRTGVERGPNRDNGNVDQHPPAYPPTSASASVPRRIIELTVDEDEFADDFDFHIDEF